MKNIKKTKKNTLKKSNFSKFISLIILLFLVSADIIDSVVFIQTIEYLKSLSD